MEDRHDSCHLGRIFTRRNRRIRLTIFKRVTVIIYLIVGLVSLRAAAAQTCNDLKLTAPDPIEGERFGNAIDIDGTTLVVGASGTIDGQSPFPGRAFVYEWIGGAWEYQATLTSNGLRDGDRFGASVAVDGDVIVIGVSRALDERGRNTGAAMVFEHPAEGWRSTNQPTAVLFPSRGETGALFGAGVDVSGNWIFVAAPQADSNVIDSGVVYAFRRDGQAWTEEQILERPRPVKREHFGLKIQLQNDLAIIGAPNIDWHSVPGTVHVFILGDGGQWNHVQELDGGPDRDKGDHFGRSIALARGDSTKDYLLAIGSAGDDDFGQHSRSAYVFQLERQSSGYRFVQTAKLVAQNGRAGDHLGFSIAVHGDLIAIGAPSFDWKRVSNRGAEYVFKQTNTTGGWTQKLQVIAECPTEEDRLGASCEFFVDPDSQDLRLLIGAPGYDSFDDPDAGAVYVIGP